MRDKLIRGSGRARAVARTMLGLVWVALIVAAAGLSPMHRIVGTKSLLSLDAEALDAPATTVDRPLVTSSTVPATTASPSTTTTTTTTTSTVPPTTTASTTVPVTSTVPPPPTTPSPPEPATAPAASPSPAIPGSNAPMPRGDLPGWTQVFADDFTKDAPLGSFDAVYGRRWTTYDGPDTSGKMHPNKRSSYNTDKVVSVHGGVLDKFLHTEFDANGYNGAGKYMMSAGLLPKIGGQLHGRYSVRLRADAVDGYKIAWLLWPDSGAWPRDGEIDFAETDLVAPLKAFIHRRGATSGDDQTACSTHPPAYLSAGWHTVTLEWTDTIKVYVDGALECSSADRIPNKPMHLVLQTESELFGAKSAKRGHLYLDWVTVYRESAA